MRNNSKHRVISAIIALWIIQSLPVYGQEGTTWFGDSADGQWLIGVKLGEVTNDDAGYRDVSNSTVVLGYQLAREIGVEGTASVELEISDSDDADTRVAGSQWEVRTAGLFINYRTPGTVYFKAKIGILNSRIKTNSNGVQLSRATDTSFSYGAGLGIILGRQQNLNLEIEWTGTSGDNDIELFNVAGLLRF